ncbi:GIY-YIG nuclease family protein [Halomonas sp. BMC6]|uniref:GIY-YIG nuclease family protein n=1 Tax=Halomonas sp. BMC6 TaxID=3073244 RepID=UPI0030CBC149
MATEYGFVYVLANPAMPGLYKIGFTTQSVQVRISDLSRGTSVPAAFYKVLDITTYNPAAVERDVHLILRDARSNARREFFQFTSDTEAAASVLVAAGQSGFYQPVTDNRAGDALYAKPEPVKEISEQEMKLRQIRAKHYIAHFRAILDGEVTYE